MGKLGIILVSVGNSETGPQKLPDLALDLTPTLSPMRF